MAHEGHDAVTGGQELLQPGDALTSHNFGLQIDGVMVEYLAEVSGLSRETLEREHKDREKTWATREKELGERDSLRASATGDRRPDERAPA